MSLRGPGALVLATMTLASCDAWRNTAPPPSGQAAVPGVSARLAIALASPRIDGLELKASGLAARLAWAADGRHVTWSSSDGGRTFRAGDAAVPDAVRPRPFALGIAHATGDSWTISDSVTDADDPWSWTVSFAAAGSPPPAAVVDLCGLAVVVSPEPQADATALVLRRFAPPTEEGESGSPVGAPMVLDARASPARPPIVVPLAAAALVAWHDHASVRVVRVEIPDLTCSRRFRRESL
jgi:hypothetical protein